MKFASVYSDTCWPLHSSIKQDSKCRPIQAPVEEERVNTSCSAVNGETCVSSPGFFSSVAT